MNILVLNYEYPPLGGGGGVAAKKIAEGFVDNGHEVDYVTSWYPGLDRREVINGVTVHRVRVVGRDDDATASLLSMLTYPLSGFSPCVQLCRRRGYDLINTHFALPSGPLGVALATLFDIDHILSIHGGDIYDPTKDWSPHRKWYLRAAVKTVLRRADRVVAQSTDTKRNALKYYGVDREIDVIPLPYEPYSFSSVSRAELGLHPETPYLISVGRLVRRKGYHHLLEALAQLDDDEVEALIIGDGPREPELRALARRLGIEHRVRFLGYVDEATKFQYLNAADVYVLSSIHEGFGICVQEAMQTGLPIVATDSGGHTDLIEDEKNGILVPTAAPGELADAIEESLSMDTSAISAHNQRQIADYASDAICQQLLEG